MSTRLSICSSEVWLSGFTAFRVRQQISIFGTILSSQIINSLDEYGIDTSDLKKLVFDPKKTFLRVPQLGFKTEFLPHIPGLNSFKDAFTTASRTMLDGVEVFVLGYDDLIKNKEALKQPIDIKDVEELKKRNATPES